MFLIINDHEIKFRGYAGTGRGNVRSVIGRAHDASPESFVYSAHPASFINNHAQSDPCGGPMIHWHA